MVSYVPSKADVTLYTCLDKFREIEKLTGNNMWNCPQCKTPRSALKKMEIYSVPDVLIIHLKRFKYEAFGTKIGTWVDFPCRNMDISKMVLRDNGSELLYDLYAVSVRFALTIRIIMDISTVDIIRRSATMKTIKIGTPLTTQVLLK